MLIGLSASAQTIKPTATYKYVHRDTCDLYLDYYKPASGTDTAGKPTIMFVFGGGFIRGHRDAEAYLPWFKRLSEDGFPVVSIDYRLGLKGKGKVGLTTTHYMVDACNVGVEDVCAAVAYLTEHASELGIDPKNIVLSGSSAGAIISLCTDWQIANKTSQTKELPAGFKFAGIISYSGAIFSTKGPVKYASTPSPTCFLHGTADKLVPYNQTAFFNIWFEGTNPLSRTWHHKKYNYNVYRFKDNTHEIAESQMQTYDLVMDFIKHNVMNGEKRIIDKTIDDLDIEKMQMNSQTDLYKDN